MGILISHYKDPFETTWIQWKVSGRKHHKNTKGRALETPSSGDISVLLQRPQTRALTLKRPGTLGVLKLSKAPKMGWNWKGLFFFSQNYLDFFPFGGSNNANVWWFWGIYNDPCLGHGKCLVCMSELVSRISLILVILYVSWFLWWSLSCYLLAGMSCRTCPIIRFWTLEREQGEMIVK